MPSTMRQLLRSPFARRAALVLGLALLLGFAGPFSGNPPLSAPVRYAFWILMVFAGYAAALAAENLVSQTSIPRPELRLVAVAIASALPLTFVAAWAISLVRPGHDIGPLRLIGLFAPVAVVQLVIVSTVLRRPSPPAGPAATPSGESSGSFPRALLSRLPTRLGEEVVALEAEDHYLRVHTTRGSHLILMRLSDAIAAIGPELGLQVHRSWWVAADAICEMMRSDQRLRLRLTNGLEVPVGRTYSAAVRSRAANLPSGD